MLMKPLILPAVMVVALTACSVASGGDLDKAIRSFPKISVEVYRPDLAADSANTLISAGPDAAIAALGEVARSNRDLDNYAELNNKLCHLCRLLFIATNTAGPLRPPKLGMPQLVPADSMRPQDWPDLPFVITNNIPLSLRAQE